MNKKSLHPKSENSSAKKQSQLFASLGKDEEAILANFDQILLGIKPLSSKQIYQLPTLAKELSHLLTDERNSRRLGYMNDSKMLTAYTHYFMWWNLYRLSHLIAGLENNAFDNLCDGDYCVDFGSGPLTLVCAMYLARPDLRKKNLTWYCVDLCQNALNLGEEIFLSINGRLAKTDEMPWKIIRVKGDLKTHLNNKVKFFACANMFNELYYDTKMPLEEAAKQYSKIITSYLNDDASVFIVEPAFPRSSRFISLTRDCLIREKFSIIAPCPHEKTCPMDGKRGGKWCHFVMSTENAPKNLLQFSEYGDLAKDRACLSFVFATKSYAVEQHCNAKNSMTTTKPDLSNSLTFRVASDKIKLPQNKTGFYACSQIGLVLAVGIKATSGDEFIVTDIRENLPIDKKSGAKIVE